MHPVSPNSPYLNQRNLHNKRGRTPVIEVSPSKKPATEIETKVFLTNIALILRPGGEGLRAFRTHPHRAIYENAAKNIHIAVKRNKELNFNDDFVQVSLDKRNSLMVSEIDFGVEIRMNGESVRIDDVAMADLNDDNSVDKENIDPQRSNTFDSEQQYPAILSRLNNQLGQNLAKRYNVTENTLDAFVTNIIKNKDFPIHHSTLTGATNTNEPYQEISGERIISHLNGKVSVPNTNDYYWCRHFTAQYIKNVIEFLKNGGQIEQFNLAVFDTSESMSAVMPKENVDDDFNAWLENANSYSIVENDLFGTHLKKCFTKMQDNAANNSAYIVNTLTHSMAVWLRIDNSQADPFEVRFFDPNNQNVEVICRFKNLEDVVKFGLREYVDGIIEKDEDESRHEVYREEMNPYCIVLECYSDGLPVEKQKNIDFDPNNVTPTHLGHLRDHGFDFDQLTDEQLKKLAHESTDELVLLLGRKFMTDPNYLMHLDFPPRVSRVLIGELASLIPPEEFIELIAAENLKGIPAICTALAEGDHEMINMLAGYFDLIDFGDMQSIHFFKELATTIFEKLNESADGKSIMHKAIAHGHAKSLKAFLPVIKRIMQIFPELKSSLVDVIAAKDADGKPAIRLALGARDRETIMIYAHYLLLVEDLNERNALILAIEGVEASASIGITDDVLAEKRKVTLAKWSRIFELVKPSTNNKAASLASIQSHSI